MADDYLECLVQQYPRGHQKLEVEINELKRKLDIEDGFSDCDEELLCCEAEKLESKIQKLHNVNAVVIDHFHQGMSTLTSEHINNYKCDECGKQFKWKKSLSRHLKAHYASFACNVCDKRFRSVDYLTLHKKKSHSDQKLNHDVIFKCKHCGVPFDSYETLFQHVVDNHPISQTGGGVVSNNHGGSMPNQEAVPTHSANAETVKKRKTLIKSAMNNLVRQIDIMPNGNEKYDTLKCYANVKSMVEKELRDRMHQIGNIKWYVNNKVEMVRDIDDGDSETAIPHFRSKTYTTLLTDELDHDLNSAFQQMNNSMEEYINKGSNWRLNNVLSLEIVTVPYSPLNASSYVPLPRTLQTSHSVLNIQNQDEKCFVWSILASLQPVEIHAERVQHYKPYENELDTSGIDYPTSLSQIEKFEKQNNISINVFGYEKKEIFPLFLSKLDTSRHVIDLVYLKNGDRTHYCLVKDLNRFLAVTKKGHRRHYFCRRCLVGFTREDLLQQHGVFCKQFDFQKVKFPEKGKDDMLMFQNFHKQIRVPFVIYADFETLVQKIDVCLPNPAHSSTTHEAHFEPCGYAYQVICSNDKHTKPAVVYRGSNAAQHFLDNMLKEEIYIKEVLANSEPLMMTEESERRFQKADHCHICGNPFLRETIKVRDHTHVGVNGDISSSSYSNFRGASCQSCNLNFKDPNFIPVIFHNLRGFDGHILCQAAGKYKDKNIKCIANNMEKYVSFSIGNLRFIDSFQFMSSSLESLVQNLVADGFSHFKQFRKAFPSDEIVKLLLRKNVYCYDYIDSHEKFQEEKLPAKEAFYSRLKRENISDEDYIQVQTVWKVLKMKTLGDLHDNYVLTDVLLLADVFERFRDMTLDYYKLDACHYFTSPGLAWDAALKMTDIHLDLITDPLQYNFFEMGLRGGVSMISQKYSVANNSYLDSYDASKPTSYLMYYDANNLYGGVMRMPLPIGVMRWLDCDEIDKFNLSEIAQDSEVGYTLEVDLEYSAELHEAHNCYPLAPERKVVQDDEISPHNQELWWIIHGENHSRVKTCKLIPTLTDKTHYILHYRNLQLYQELGLKVKKIHKILEFQQRLWLKQYIDFNSEKRKNAKNDFEKDFFKLMNNAVFGKTMENLRNRVDIKLIQNERKLKKCVAKPSFERVKLFNEDLVGVQNKKVNLLLNKPVYVGQTILDLSKWVMYDFHYNVMKKRYGEAAKLLFTDTDSLMYEIQTEDIYMDMKENKHLYDLSNYPRDHPLFDDTNKKVVLKMKDECSGDIIQEFVGLRPIMYSMILEDGKEKKTAKGISKVAIQKQLKHENYKNCLINKTKTLNDMTLIRSENHKLFMNNVVKTGLCSFDDKRFVKDCGIHTCAYGHSGNINICDVCDSCV